jgi:hypothetical protein
MHRKLTLLLDELKLLELGGTVRDLSTGGAKLAFGSIPKLPDTFELQIPSQGKAHDVELRWQRGLQVGVQFVNTRKYVET